MAAKLNLVKRIVNDEVINSFNLIFNTLFGGEFPGFYDENKIYNKGDCIIALVDGSYKLLTAIKDNVTGPFDINDFAEVSFSDLFKDSSILTQNNNMIQSKQEAMSDDIATILYELAGLVDNRLALNVLYRENFKTSDFIDITTGLHVPGCIHALPGSGLDFSIKPVQLRIEPTKFKIKHFIEMSGAPTLGCNITFNALDENPYWFNANEALLSADFFEIPFDEFEKEDGKPYAIDLRVYGDCAVGSSLSISDLMVVFI